MFSAHSLRNKYEHIVLKQNQIWRWEFRIESCMKARLEAWRNEVTIQTQKEAVKVTERTQTALRKSLSPWLLLHYEHGIPLTAPRPPQRCRANPSGTSCARPILLHPTHLQLAETALIKDCSGIRKVCPTPKVCTRSEIRFTMHTSSWPRGHTMTQCTAGSCRGMKWARKKTLRWPLQS